MAADGAVSSTVKEHKEAEKHSTKDGRQRGISSKSCMHYNIKALQAAGFRDNELENRKRTVKQM